MQSKVWMKEFVISLLKDKIPDTYFYHNYKHTLYVIETALAIGKYEDCTAAELELIEIAALWHDTGYTITYKNHEEESCNLARHYLPGYEIPAEDIEIICGMIMATQIPQTPKNKLEEILADADLEYLGTEDFEPTAYDLFRELQFINPLLTNEKWNMTQILFLKNHHFFTGYGKQFREKSKQLHLTELQQRVNQNN